MPTTSIEAAETDGRAHSPRFIQRQLSGLHKALADNSRALQSAIIADTHVSQEEAQVEFALAISAVRELYVSVDVDASLAEEYRIACGEDWRSRRVPVGIVYIRPQSQSFLFSVVSPLASAIAAGNCVVVEVGVFTPWTRQNVLTMVTQFKNSLQEVPRVLRGALSGSLDHDTFAIVESTPSDPAFKKHCIIVDQTRTVNEGFPATLRAPSGDLRSIAVVDRSSDIVTAARHIVQARTAFQGHSAYAPDLVLVNEFALAEFVEAAVASFTKQISGFHRVYESEEKILKPRRKEKEDVLSNSERTDPGTTVVLDGDRGAIVKVTNRCAFSRMKRRLICFDRLLNVCRKLAILQKKITNPTLVIHPISSLDDAIDFANAS